MVSRLTLAVLIALYPVLVFFGIKILPPGLIGLVLVLLLLARFGLVRPHERKTAVPIATILITYALATTVLGSERLLLYYPVVVNAVFLVLFAVSLRSTEPILLRMVRNRGVAIGEQGVIYLARLTAIWAGFFLVNGLIAAWSTTADLKVWTLYNGFISHVVIAAMVLGELMFRRYYKKRHGLGNE